MDAPGGHPAPHPCQLSLVYSCLVPSWVALRICTKGRFLVGKGLERSRTPRRPAVLSEHSSGSRYLQPHIAIFHLFIARTLAPELHHLYSSSPFLFRPTSTHSSSPEWLTQRAIQTLVPPQPAPSSKVAAHSKTPTQPAAQRQHPPPLLAFLSAACLSPQE